jgi:hypothetical protein
MERKELKARADWFKALAVSEPDAAMRLIYYRKAQAYYQDAGFNGLARKCGRNIK